jgi:hypothetical protein
LIKIKKYPIAINHIESDTELKLVQTDRAKGGWEISFTLKTCDKPDVT